MSNGTYLASRVTDLERRIAVLEGDALRPIEFDPVLDVDGGIRRRVIVDRVAYFAMVARAEDAEARAAWLETRLAEHVAAISDLTDADGPPPPPVRRIVPWAELDVDGSGRIITPAEAEGMRP